MCQHYNRKPKPKRIYIKPIELLEKGIIITDHSVKQWHERVTPGATKDDIKQVVINSVLNHHFLLSWQDYYSIEENRDEIVLCLERDLHNNIILTTVMGRVSNVPHLRNIEPLIKSMRIHGKINLSLPKEM